MLIPLIPTWLLVALCVLIVILTGPAVFRIPSLPNEKMIILFAGGLIFLAVGFLVYGVLYYYFVNFVVDAEVRQRAVRFTFAFLESVIVVWLLAIIFRKGNL